MKTRKNTKKVAKAPAAAKNGTINVNMDYVDQIADESIATIMALRALIHRMADEIEILREQLEASK